MDRLPSLTETKKQQHRRPIECRFCKEHEHFRVTQARGNTLHRGGYGYVISALDEEAQADVVEEEEDTLIKDSEMKCENKKTVATAQHYLFIEEVLFLFEQGLLHAFRDNDDDTAQVTRTKPNDIVTATPAEVSENVEEVPLSRYELFQLLEPAGVALPTYLVYQHLRAQTFRVVRHTPTRRSIILQQLIISQAPPNKSSTTNATHSSLEEERILVLGSDAERKNSHVATDSPPTVDATTSTAAPPHRPHTLQYWKRQLRGDARRALPPQFDGSTLAWDGYRPTASFAAAAPGLPDFYVAMAHMTNAEKEYAATSSTFTFRDLQSLLQQTIVPSANKSVEKEETRIPLKIATVSDSGTVLLFGITDFGVPMNIPPEATPAMSGNT